MRNFKLFAQMLTLLTGLLFFAGCQQEEIASPNSSIQDRDSKTSLTPNSTTTGYYGLGPSNEIYKFSLRPAYAIQSTKQISGMRAGEMIVAIDVRPANGGLYGVSNMSRIYLIDPASGLTKPLSQGNFSPAINGTSVGFDFNPATDRITLVTDTGQGLIIHPATGQVVGTATLPVTGTTGVTFSGGTMYVIDGATGTINAADFNGNVKPVGSTGLTIVGEGGMDTKNGMTLAVLNASGVVHSTSTAPDDLSQQAYRIYSIDVNTGQASSLGVVSPMIGIAAQK